MNIKSIMNDILTGIDGESVDIARVLGLLAVVFYMGMTIYTVGWKGQPFDYANWGIGAGSVIAAMGAAIRLKQDTEPKAK